MKIENYRGYEIYKVRSEFIGHNYDFIHKDFDGDGVNVSDHRYGHGDTIEECRELIDELIEEEND